MAKKTDYRALKNELNKYFKFSFPMPRKGKEFTPQQKSAITRKARKIAPFFERDGSLSTKVSFIKYPKKSKLTYIDGVRTDHGIFYKHPGAKVKKEKNKRRYRLQINYGIVKEKFYPFPQSVGNSMAKIKKFVEDLEEKLKPDYIRWSKENQRASQRYDPGIFEKYFTTIKSHPKGSAEYYQVQNVKKKFRDDTGYYNGVFIGWLPD
jgi:hypothetical protein